MTNNKSHNIMRMEGVDDMEYVNELGLDPALAYTPEINEAIVANVAAGNYASYIELGKSPEEAQELTDNMIKHARANIAEALPALAKAGY